MKGIEKTVTLYVQRYDLAANGFYFDNLETYTDKSVNLRNSYGDIVEEFDIQPIDGSELDRAFATPPTSEKSQ